jgi:hypothetical protein
LSTLGPAPTFALGLLLAVDSSSTAWAVLAPVGTWAEQHPAAATRLTVFLVEQHRFQFPVQRQDSSTEIFADQGTGDALNADARLPAIVQQQAVPIYIVAALVYQPLNSAKLLVSQMWY